MIGEGGEDKGAGGEMTAGGAGMWCTGGVSSGVGLWTGLSSSTSWLGVSEPESETGREVVKGSLEQP